MSITKEAVWAAAPSTRRGYSTQLSSDPKGERLAYASNKSIFLRSIDNPAIATEYTGHKAETTVARFSPSGYYVASGDDAGTVRVWDCVGDGIKKGEYEIISGRIHDLAWDGDSQRIIAVGAGKRKFGRCITADSGNTVGEISGHIMPINSVSIRQQRPLRAATAGDDRTLVFYHGAPFKYVNGLRDLHANYIWGVSFSPDGANLVSVGGDRRIWLYDGKTGEQKSQIGEGEHTGSIFGVSWSQTSDKFVTASADRTVKIWDVEHGKAIQSWTIGGEGTPSVPNQQVGVVWPSGRSDGLIISLSLSGNLNYLAEGASEPVRVVEGHGKGITCMAGFASGGEETLWTGSYDGRVCSWDVAAGSAVTVQGDGHTSYVSSLVPVPEGTGRIYSVGWDDTLRASDLHSKAFIGDGIKLSAQPKGVASATDAIIVANADGIEVFANGVQTGNFPLKSPLTTAAAHGSIVAVGGEDASLRIYALSGSGLDQVAEITALRNPINVLAFSPDGTLLAAGDSRGRVLIYKAADGSLVTDRWTAHNARVTSIAWNEQGSHLVTGSLDTHIFVWSLAKPGEWLQVFNAHKDGVNGVAWIAGGAKIASAGADAAVKLQYASFILPRTGQRIKRLISLTPDVEHGESLPDDRTPLLPQSGYNVKRRDITQRWRKDTLRIIRAFHSFAVSEAGQGVLKCSLAYLLGTLATFVPAIAGTLGKQDGKHMVATITVYFHPARTKGSMYEALICAALAFVYAAFISVTSMAVAVLFQDILHLRNLGHAIVLLVFCGGGLGFVGWVKLRRGTPLASVACSLASLAIITVLTKEGAVQQGDMNFAKISQVLKMIVMGVIAAMTTCFFVFPLSARTKLRQEIAEVTDSLADMLGIITESFIQGSSEQLEDNTFVSAAGRNKKAFTAVDKMLKEAKLEHYAAGVEREYRLEKRLVRCIQDISQNIGGLRSAAALQFSLLKQSSPDSDRPLARDPTFGFRLGESYSMFSQSPRHEPEEPNMMVAGESLLSSRYDAIDSKVTLSPADIFERFIVHLGPSMRSLAYTLKEILAELPYGPKPDYQIVVNSRFRSSLDRALELYRDSRNDALAVIYRQKDIAKIESLEAEADLEEVAASCGHFSFSLLEFAEQLKGFLQILDELQLEVEERPNGRSWSWFNWWRTIDDFGYIRARTLYESTEVGRAYLNSPKNRPSMTTFSNDLRRPSQKLRYRLWKALHILRRYDMRFSIKVGAGAALYALPSFLTSTRPVYCHWRGEWGLLSYMLVCSMTIGASNTTGFARFLGTSLGAVSALAAWYMTQGNVFALAFIGWLMAVGTAYLIIAKGQGPMGRFIMLTYNLIVLYSYSLSRQDNEDGQDEGGDNPNVANIAVHRVISVVSGVIWGIIVTRVIWPFSARQKLKDGFSLFWLRLSVIWKRDPLSSLTQEGDVPVYFTPREKLELQRFLAHLESLQVAARSEFELKGPFPEAAYSNLLIRTRRILEGVQAMNLEIMKNLTASEGEAAMLNYTLLERQQLSARISHLLSVVASSMKLEYPLDNALPNTEHARDRLLARLHRFRKDTSVSHLTTDEDYALLYAYVLVTGQLCDEIMAIITDVGNLFGILTEDVLKLE
ncbi:hypothetical protein AJ80_07215 [Polytolypa hystricis UAMH7299]|uniref:Integral membrane bound transporter domain-containing protein n=1 Tax=Polytolypa hystricis (strain UAMH7299) TaxID=1447883 RepID=A0A2B7XQF9_POLH7|nr:hypothetical protein AJ80_07215 [Polytolypa hystricis UAMH7299]